jgi:hypothetical protein
MDIRRVLLVRNASFSLMRGNEAIPIECHPCSMSDVDCTIEEQTTPLETRRLSRSVLLFKSSIWPQVLERIAS